MEHKKIIRQVSGADGTKPSGPTDGKKLKKIIYTKALDIINALKKGKVDSNT